MNLAKSNRIWQHLTGILAVIILAVLVAWLFIDPKVNMFQWLLWLHLPLLMLHEFEEYIYPGGFKKFFNTKSPFALPQPEENVPIDPPLVFFVNMAAWFLIILGALLAKVAPWLGMMMVVFQVGNVALHGFIFPAKTKGYNPGMVTAIFLFVPYIVTVFWFSIARDILSPAGYVISIIGGILLALSLPASAEFNIKRFLKG